jgi:hypothetical protein
MNPIAPKELQQERLNICSSCPNYNEIKDKCKECGCYMAYKILLKKSKCPLQKW